ncbi:hypothetical protein [Halorussus salinus]|uniref:hypothetical protein n=1 Tax=Halorussus salinus TaxID=1364935 RepID=UPI001091AF35|nr:hypothetical protein [Halorussus salinus]
MARRHPRSRRRQTHLESDLATEFDATVLHNKVYEDIGGDDELAKYCDALAAAEDARDIHEGPDGRSERWESMDDACQRFEAESRRRAREVAAEACATIIDEGDEWTDVWDDADIEETQQEAREWLAENTETADRLGLPEEVDG